MNSNTIRNAISPRFLNRDISISGILVILFILDFFNQVNIQHTNLFGSLYIASLNAILYTLILWITIRVDLARVTLLFLALPYLLFIPGWLNLPTTVVMLCIFLYCLVKTLNHTTAIKNPTITIQHILAFLLILTWVNLSGAGGYGYQTDDYTIHNARLKDLVEQNWPVRYGDNQNFVYYIGYFLPSAVFGKITTLGLAQRSMFLWTAMGVSLSIRWLSFLSQWKFSVGLVLIFIFFGPMDLLSVLYQSTQTNFSVLKDPGVFFKNSDLLDFSISYQLGFHSNQSAVFLGNFLSNTFQLYWSPQQVLSSWLCISLLMFLFINKQFDAYIFIYALLCLWAPLPMIAILPFIFITTIYSGAKIRAFFTFENTIGAGSLIVVFLLFYLAGSTSNNPSYWLFSVIDTMKHWDVLLAFILFGWGIYAIAISPHLLQFNSYSKILFCGLIASLIILPLRTFGEYGDLLCRGSAPLMFILLTLILQTTRHYWNHNQRISAILILCLLSTGFCSAIIQHYNAIVFYGKTRPVATLTSYSNAYPNLGPDNTLFEKWLRKPLTKLN